MRWVKKILTHDRLDLLAVGIEGESAVETAGVLRPRSGRTRVATAMG